MLKINSVKLLIFLKLIQIFFIVTLSGFTIALFSVSVFIIPEKILMWGNNNGFNTLLDVGFYTIGSYNDGTLWHNLTPTFISLVSVICILFVCLSINTFCLWKKFYFDRNLYLELSVCCIASTVMILFIIFLMNFINPIQILNDNTKWKDMNLLFNYSLTYREGYSIINTRLTDAGITYCVILSYLIVGLMYFPIKIIYNLVKAKYI